MPSGYSETVTGDVATGFVVTNSHTPEKTSVHVQKVWDDDKAYGTVITLSADNGWKYPVTLPVCENGKEIVWTIAETNIPKYYSASYDQKTLTVTNTIQSKEIPKTGDDSNLLLWASMMLLSCAGAAAVLFYDRKRKSNRS